jgi:hypothetical protein
LMSVSVNPHSQTLRQVNMSLKIFIDNLNLGNFYYTSVNLSLILVCKFFFITGNNINFTSPNPA